ncbi:MAG: hypothetical protein ACE5MG_01480 [Candidatus Methylomirabilales bacterium]
MEERLNRLQREQQYMRWALAVIVIAIVAWALFGPGRTGRYQIVSPSDAFFVHRLNTSTGEIQTLVLGRPDVERQRYEFQQIAVWPGGGAKSVERDEQ